MSAWRERDDRRHYSYACFDGVHDRCRANACVCGCHGPEAWRRNPEVAAREYARRRFLAQLSADGPVIVVDGKVVELAVDSDESRDWAPWVTELSRRLALPDLDLAPGWYMSTFGELLDAAREVAE